MPYEVPSNRPQSEFKGGIQILASVHFDYTKEGGTIDAAAAGANYYPAGSPFVQNVSTGRYVPFVAATHVAEGVLAAGFRDPVLSTVDFTSDGENHVVVGQLLWRGEVYEAKLPDTVTAEFRAVNPNIRYNYRGL